MILVFSRPVRWHLERALAAHFQWCRTNGLPVPTEVRQLLVALATDGQQRTDADEIDNLGDAAPVALALDYEAAGGRLGVSERTVRRLVGNGRLTAVSIAGCRRIRVADLAAYLESLEAA